MKNNQKILSLLAWLLICQVPAVIGGLFVSGGMTWYRTLEKPPLTPPNALFGAAWSVLYVLLGISAFMLLGNVWREKTKLTALFLGQLVLNTLWTPVFFGMQSLGGALFVILVMLAQGGWLARVAWQENRAAVCLMLPYFAWLCFATYLTAAFWGMN